MNKFDKETFHFIFVLITSVVLFVILLHLIGCSSIPISPDKKCRATNLAGDSWANNDLTNVMSFNDDCSGMFLVKDDEQSCTGHFTYEMTDYANVFLNFKDAQCDIKKGLYKCSYSLIHLTESNIEVMDISCSWNNKMEQLIRYEK